MIINAMNIVMMVMEVILFTLFLSVTLEVVHNKTLSKKDKIHEMSVLIIDFALFTVIIFYLILY